MPESVAKIVPHDKPDDSGTAPAQPPPERKKPFLKNGKPMTLRMKIFETFEDPSYSAIAKWISMGMMLLIVLATVCFVLESEATIETGGLYETDALAVFTQIELVSTIVFTLEYIIRIACCPCENYGVLRFVFNVQNIIDLLAFLPFWVTAIAKIFNPDGDGSGLGFLRVIRLIRVFRVFKFGKYSAGIQMFAGAIGKSTQPLSILLFTFCLAVIILSSVMYMVEGAQSDTNSTAYNEELLNMAGFDQSVHQYCFGSIPRCFWWAIVTMTTVGYGDCYPVSTMGKCLAMLTMLLGVLILALPITVVGSNFQKMVEMYEEESGMRREFDQNEDGDIDEAELRQFLLAKRKDNALRKVDINGKSIDLNPERLMLKYDPQGNGKLNFEEFQNLKRDIIDPAAADPQANIRILLKRTADTEERVAMIEEHLLLIGKHLGVAPPPPKREASLSDFSGELGGSSDATRSAAGAGG